MKITNKVGLKIFVVCGVLFFLGACANVSYLADECYLGNVDAEKRSYLQVCFVGDNDPRGRFIQYSETVVKNSTGLKGLLCKQSFKYVRSANTIEIDSYRGRCGIKADFKGAKSYKVIEGMVFFSNIETCSFTSSDTLSCFMPDKNQEVEFVRVVRKDGATSD